MFVFNFAFQARKGELVAKYSTLTGYIADLCQVYPLCKLIVVVMGMETYYRWVYMCAP